MEEKNILVNLYLGETIIAGIGQGYIQTTPIQLCKMIAQIANGGFKIKPSLNANDNFELGEKIIENEDHLKIIKESLDILPMSGRNII